MSFSPTMANQKMLSLAFAFAAVNVNADNCARVNSRYSLKTSLTNLYCATNSMTCESRRRSSASCVCQSCCEVTAGTCYKLEQTGSTCTGTRVIDDAKELTQATAADYDTTCCKADPTCASHTCSTGMVKKANIDATLCGAHECSDTTCCDADTTKCKGATGSCTAPAFYDWNKDGVAATTATYNANCCITTTTTTTTAPTCGSHTCDAWEISLTGTTATTNCGGFAGDTVANRCGPTCCTDDTTKCKGAYSFLNVTVALGCDTTTQFQDPAKYSVAVSTAAGWKAACCTDKATCTTFSSHSYSGSAAGAEKMQKPATGLLLLVVGTVFTFAK